jgi:hypothetical protein
VQRGLQQQEAVLLMLMLVLPLSQSLLPCARGLLGQQLVLLLQQHLMPSLLLRKQAAAERRVLGRRTSQLGREIHTCRALQFAGFVQVGLAPVVSRYVHSMHALTLLFWCVHADSALALGWGAWDSCRVPT